MNIVLKLMNYSKVKICMDGKKYFTNSGSFCRTLEIICIILKV